MPFGVEAQNDRLTLRHSHTAARRNFLLVDKTINSAARPSKSIPSAFVDPIAEKDARTTQPVSPL